MEEVAEEAPAMEEAADSAAAEEADSTMEEATEEAAAEEMHEDHEGHEH
jgi:hypothetical protein